MVCHVGTETTAEIQCHEWSMSDFSQVSFQVLFCSQWTFFFIWKHLTEMVKKTLIFMSLAHEPCRWWSESLPYRFFQFNRDLTWKPLLSFPFLFLDLEPMYHAGIKIMGQIWGYWASLFSNYRSLQSSDFNRNNRINNNNMYHMYNRSYNEYPLLIQSSMPYIV